MGQNLLETARNMMENQQQSICERNFKTLAEESKPLMIS
jgi:hypothetical protein